mgnify:CR=1 FL=1
MTPAARTPDRPLACIVMAGARRGAGDAPAAVNVMFAISLFTLAALMVAAYRASDEGVARAPGTVAMGFGVFMVVAGVAGLATNQLSVEHDTPFVNSGLLALGAGFGMLRGVLVALGLVMLGGMTPLPQDPMWKNAVLSGPLETAVVALRPFLPEDMARRIRYR